MHNVASWREGFTINTDWIQCQAVRVVAAKVQENKMAVNMQQSPHLTCHHPHLHCLIRVHCHHGLCAAPAALDSLQFLPLV